MKQYNIIKYRFLTLLIALIAMSACTKVVEVDIDAAAPKVVIEAEVSDGPGPHTVYISKSVGIDDANVFPQVQGAFVTLADDEGNADTLQETMPGYYASTSIVGRPGHTYTLTVTVETETFTALSTMPQPVPIDSLFNFTAAIFGGTRYPVILMLQDPANVGNQYRFIWAVNGVRNAGSVPENDDFFDGQSTQIFLAGLGGDVHLGDSVVVEMQNIDGQVFEYFDSFGSSGNGPGGSSAPANPYTNIQGGALGYFNACSKSVGSLVIQ